MHGAAGNADDTVPAEDLILREDHGIGSLPSGKSLAAGLLSSLPCSIDALRRIQPCHGAPRVVRSTPQHAVLANLVVALTALTDLSHGRKLQPLVAQFCNLAE